MLKIIFNYLSIKPYFRNKPLLPFHLVQVQENNMILTKRLRRTVFHFGEVKLSAQGNNSNRRNQDYNKEASLLT